MPCGGGRASAGRCCTASHAASPKWPRPRAGGLLRPFLLHARPNGSPRDGALAHRRAPAHPGSIKLEEQRVQVLVRDNNVDQALKALKKKMQREGMFREMELRGQYETPSEKKGREKAEAIRRARKLARKRMQREGLLPMKPKPTTGPGAGPARGPRRPSF